MSDCVKCHGLQQLLRASGVSPAAATLTTARTERSVQVEDVVEGDKQASASPRAGVPVEIQWLVEFLVDHALDKVSLTFISNIHGGFGAIVE